MTVVDASVWVSAATPVDAFHDVSRRWVRSHDESGDGFAAPTIVFPEVAGAVMRRTQDEAEAVRARGMVAQMTAPNVIALDQELAELAADLAVMLGLRGADAVYVATSVRLGSPLVTLDHEMIRKTSGVIDASLPGT